MELTTMESLVSLYNTIYFVKCCEKEKNDKGLTDLLLHAKKSAQLKKGE